MKETTATDDLLIGGAERGDLTVKESSLTASRASNLRSYLAFLGLALIGTIVAATVWSDPGTSCGRSGLSQQSQFQQGGIGAKPVFQSNGILFNASLELFNPDIVKGYTGTDELRNDLINALRFSLNGIVAKNIAAAADSGTIGTDSWAPSGEEAGAHTHGNVNPRSSRSSRSSRRLDTKGDYDTHNQEAGAEEGDIIVSNGETVFGAYGDYILVWNATSGEIVSKVKLPTVQSDNYTWPAQIRNLLLHKDRLVVIVDGYGGTFKPPNGRQYPILYGYKSTQVRLYSIAPTGSLTLLSSNDLNGYYSDVRAINGSVHIVASSGIDIYTDLVPQQNFSNSSLQQYVVDVQHFAELAIPRFVNELLDELTVDSVLPNLFRLSLFLSQLTNDTFNQSMGTDAGLMTTINLVHSFDMIAANQTTLNVSTSGAFLPFESVVYSSTKIMVLSVQQYNYDVATQSSSSTYLLSLKLNGATSIPYSTGTLPGSVLNSQSFDVVGNVLRVATSVEIDIYGPPPVNYSFPVYYGENQTNDDKLTNDSGPILYDYAPLYDGENLTNASDPVFYDPGPVYYPDYTFNRTTQNYVTLLDISDSNMTVLGRIQLGKPEETFQAVRFIGNMAYAVTFQTTGSLYAVNLTDPTKPSVAAELELLGYSMALNPINNDGTLILSIGQETNVNGTLLGLEISVFDFRDLADVKVVKRSFVDPNGTSWFSSEAAFDNHAFRYSDGLLLIPLDIDNWEYPVQEFHGLAVFSADTNGITEKCRISTAGPTPVSSYDTTYTNNTNMINTNGDDMIYTNGTVTTPQAPQVCYYCASLPRRSFIFGGKVMTTDGHLVLSTDVDTCKQEWKTDIVISDANGGCCY